MPPVPLDVPTVACMTSVDKTLGAVMPFSAYSATVDFVIDPHDDHDVGNSIIFFTYKGQFGASEKLRHAAI